MPIVLGDSIQFPDATVQSTAATGGSVSVPLGQQAWVVPNGDDGTGEVGNAAKPFATIVAAEAAITDASISKRYTLNIGAGSFDFTAATKKAYISWTGLGNETTYITTTSGDINLTGPDLAVPSSSSLFNFTTLHLVAPVNMDTVGAGLTAPSGAQYWFDGVHFSAMVTVTGLGGDSVGFECANCYLNGGYAITSISAQLIGCFVGGSVTVTGASSLGCQAIHLGSSVFATVNVVSTGGTFALFGAIGSLVGGDITADGAAASLYLGADATSGDPVLLNGAGVQYQASSKHINFTGARERFTTQTVADVSNSLNNTYFTFGGPDGTSYYVWYNVSGAGVDPAPGGTGIEVDIATDDIADTVAAATSTAIQSSGVASTSTVTNVSTAYMNNFGPCVSPADGGAPTGFTFMVVTTGTNINLGSGLSADVNGSLATIRGVNYSWPTSHGSAGNALVDTDGAGTLAWTSSPVTLQAAYEASSVITIPVDGQALRIDNNDNDAYAPTLFLNNNAGANGPSILINRVGGGIFLSVKDQSNTYNQTFSTSNMSSDVNWNLPPAYGAAGTVLTDTDGAGTLGWLPATSQPMVPDTQAETFTVTTVADVAGSLSSTYFEFYSANDATHYYAWFKVNGVGIDPAIGGAIGIEVDLALNDADTVVASALQAAVSAAVTGDFLVTVLGSVVTAVSNNFGPATDVADGGAPTGFAFVVTNQGQNASSSTAGSAGELRYDQNYVYVCVATNTWKRAALTTF